MEKLKVVQVAQYSRSDSKSERLDVMERFLGGVERSKVTSRE